VIERACELNGMDRSTYRYEPVADRNAELRKKLTELARRKPRYGYRRLGVLLERERETVARGRSHAAEAILCRAAECTRKIYMDTGVSIEDGRCRRVLFTGGGPRVGSRLLIGLTKLNHRRNGKRCFAAGAWHRW
jgi:hypothetical protein